MQILDVEAFFSARYYNRRYGSYAVHQHGEWAHYVGQGERKGFCPVGYFSPSWWKATFSLDEGPYETCFEHYLRDHSEKAPSDLYSTIAGACFAGEEELATVLVTGGRSRSGLIDLDFIEGQNTTKAEAPNAICVYLRLVGEGRCVSPTPFFDPVFYKTEYRDIAGWIDPYLHFVTAGLFEGRRPSAFVKSKIDFERYADKQAALRDIFSPAELFEVEYPYEFDRGDPSSIMRAGRPHIPANLLLGEPHIRGTDDYERMLPVFLAYRDASK